MQISFSKMNSWFFCNRYYWYEYEQRMARPTPIPLVFGAAIHRAIDWLHNGDPRQRRKRIVEMNRSQLHFQSAESFGKFWGWLWYEFTQSPNPDPAVLGCPPYDAIDYETLDERLISEKIGALRGFGKNLLKRHYELHSMYGPFPIEVEQRFVVSLGDLRSSLNGVELIGVFDQLWAGPYPDSGHQIVDFKTGWTFYSLPDERKQLPLHKNFQFSLYSLAYRLFYGKPEAGLVWYPIHYKRNENGVPVYWYPVRTFRTHEDHEAALNRVEEFIQGLEDEEFGQTEETKRCEKCIFFEPCRGKEARVSNPIDPEALATVSRESQIRDLTHQISRMDPKVSQLRLKLKRRKQDAAS